ncbi:hypothetical protein BCD67_11090 [Oscillatoriales cyanobacterium USR001]|nr:hypothetical protein BCD67_11090 [Oscillatoriales cyanobacterium USR001]
MKSPNLQPIKSPQRSTIKPLSIPSFNIPKKLTKMFWLGGLLLTIIEPGSHKIVLGQAIVPANDGTETFITPNGNRFDINGGKKSADGANLFHSFQQFGLNEGQIANFLTNPSIQNILGRVVGGNPSVINGLITVTGGNSNLFLMNPSGIIFGANAQLNVPADFSATTATGIGFNSGWFSAGGPNDYSSLIGTPSLFAFSIKPSGNIVNNGILAVAPGQTLRLMSPITINNGQLEAPGGNIITTILLDKNVLRISQPGHLLNLEIPVKQKSALSPNPNFLKPEELPELLTGGSDRNATNIIVNSNGQLVLTRPNNPETPGNTLSPSILALSSAIPGAVKTAIENNFNLSLPPLENNINTSIPLPLPPLSNENNTVIPLPLPPSGKSNNNINASISAPMPLLSNDKLPIISGNLEPLKIQPFPSLPGNTQNLIQPPMPSQILSFNPNNLDPKMMPSGTPGRAMIPPNGDLTMHRFDFRPPPESGETIRTAPQNNNSVRPVNAIVAETPIVLSREIQFFDKFGDNILNAKVTPQTIRETLGKITDQTGNHSAIIYVTAFADQLELVLFTPTGTPIRKTVPEATRQKLLVIAREFRSEITNPRRINTNNYLDSAQQLYKWLILPLEETLEAEGINTLLFSMDGGLRSLPLAALHDGKQFLIEKYSFSLIPSISLTDTRYQSLQNASVLAMGASQFKDLSPLPAVPVELSTIVGNLWPGKAFLNQEFTVENLKLQRHKQPYQIIHLATHGEFNPGAAANSYIQLWDTKLQLDQLRQLGWNDPPVELLVLSSCRTALGDEETELGFAGLAFQAGVKSALASLWYVSDQGTLALMSEFYHQLKVAPIKAEALRQAQIAMIKDRVRIDAGILSYISPSAEVRGNVTLPSELIGKENPKLTHPYYWSAFMMIGSPW